MLEFVYFGKNLSKLATLKRKAASAVMMLVLGWWTELLLETSKERCHYYFLSKNPITN